MANKEGISSDEYGNCIPTSEKISLSGYIDYTPVPRQDIKVTMEQVVKLSKETGKKVRLVIGGSEMIVVPSYAEHLEEVFIAGHYHNMNVDEKRIFKLVPKITDRRG